MVGLLFWPRGRRRAGPALADAYADTARYLGSAVNYGHGPVRRRAAAHPGAAADQQRAAAAGRRLDDAFRNYLAETRVKHLPLPEVATLITGVTGCGCRPTPWSTCGSGTTARSPGPDRGP